MKPHERLDVRGKVVVVTGSSSGLGQAFAVGLAQAGCDVGIGARRRERLEGTRARIMQEGSACVAVQTDVVVPEDCQELVEQTVTKLGRVDVLVNNAGIGTAVPATRETPEEFQKVIDINLSGSYWMAQACARVMQPGSSIINVGSVLGSTTAGLPQAAYAASKSGIIGLTRDLAQQWTGRKGIRVNALAPGFFETEMTAQHPADYVQKVIDNRIPAGRIGRLEEIVAAVVFLASDASSYVSGALIPVDGGLLTT